MAHRSVGQLSLADGLVRSGGSRALDRLITAVDWSRFDRVLGGLHASVRGRPSFAPLTMFKCLLLQQWYGLSDPGLEEALADRLSFRRFVGLSLDESVPDHSTLSRFRTRLGEDGLAERLFDDLAAQLSEAGLILREGTLIDATVVQADAVPYSHERAAERSDKDAGFTMTRRGYRLGYKAHVAMDKGSRLIRRAVLTPANQHELDPVLAPVRGPGSRLVQGDEAEVYADTAYDSRAFRAQLAERGIADRVLRRSFRGRPLTLDAMAANARHAPERVAIESLFGLMKRHYGYARVRYRSLVRNATQLQLLCMAINLRRAMVLMA